MKNEKELKEFIKRLSKITGFIADYGNSEENDHVDFGYLCDLEDILSWVLDDSPLDTLLQNHLLLNKSNEIEVLKIIEKIEKRTGKKFEKYQI